MTCIEFQNVLPEIIDTTGTPAQEAHLRTCATCGSLVADLRAIAQQARQLEPLAEPPAHVWQNIARQAEREGLMRPQQQPVFVLRPEPGVVRWPGLGLALRWAAVATLALVAVVAVTRWQPQTAPEQPVLSGARAATMNPEDRKLLAQVNSEVRPMYEETLADANAYIRDASRALNENPDDELARALLMQAYEQRAGVYEMAVSRSVE